MNIVIEKYQYDNTESAAVAYLDELQKRVTENKINNLSDLIEVETEFKDELRKYHDDVKDAEYDQFFTEMYEVVSLLENIHLCE